MSKRDYYEVLGVSRDADEKALKSAYRKLAMQYHPDRNPDDAEAEARFKEAGEAWDVLKDAEKRAAYDRFGHAAFEGGGMGGGGMGGGAGFGGAFSDVFDDLFGDFMGRSGGGRGGRGARGADLRYNMEISLQEAFEGHTTTIHVPVTETCDSCDGTGAASPADIVTCGTCGGAGRVRATQGFFTVERTCPTCQGAGRSIKKPCGACGGAGRIERKKNLSVTIPAGVEDGTRMRLSGEGDAGMGGGETGDLYIYLSVKPHHLFHRDGAHIYCRVPLSVTTAALGGTVEVPTIDGQRVRLDIPEGTQSGKQFRLRGKGMTQVRTPSRGDMYVEAGVETPVNLTKRQKELLKEFASESSDNSPESSGFFSKVKDFFEGLTD